MLTFDAETHTYRWNGVKVPGVTSILADYIRIEVGGGRFHVHRHSGRVIASSVMEEAAAKGQDIHLACQLSVQGGVDWGALDVAYVEPVRQFERWRETYQPEVLYSEAAFYSRRHGYAGTIDLIATLPTLGKKLAFVDIKTGSSSSVGPQTAAYEQGWCEDNKYRGGTERWVLWLPKDGSPFKFERLTNRLDFDYFKACLFQYNYLRGGQ